MREVEKQTALILQRIDQDRARSDERFNQIIETLDSLNSEIKIAHEALRNREKKDSYSDGKKYVWGGIVIFVLGIIGAAAQDVMVKIFHVVFE